MNETKDVPVVFNSVDYEDDLRGRICNLVEQSFTLYNLL